MITKLIAGNVAVRLELDGRLFLLDVRHRASFWTESSAVGATDKLASSLDIAADGGMYGHHDDGVGRGYVAVILPELVKLGLGLGEVVEGSLLAGRVGARGHCLVAQVDWRPLYNLGLA
jgi:hypothetical protein